MNIVDDLEKTKLSKVDGFINLMKITVDKDSNILYSVCRRYEQNKKERKTK